MDINGDTNGTAIEKMLKDYRLTTAEIIYHMPDYPGFLQTYVWQEYDIAPQFPVLNKFLHFWSHNLDGRLHSVYVASQKLVIPASWNGVGFMATIQ